MLTTEEEKKLYHYVLDMCDMGYGLSVEDVRAIAFQIAEKSGRKHPFKDGNAGRDWYIGFCRRHPTLALRKPEALSYMRAKCTTSQVVEDFLRNLELYMHN